MLLTYFKPLIKKKLLLQPKNVLTVEFLDFDKIHIGGSKIKIPLIAPNSANNYEFGYYIGSLYGNLVSWETNEILVAPNSDYNVNPI